MAGTLTALGEAMALDTIFDATAVTRPTTWFMALHAGANGGAGAANEISGNNYVRQSVTFFRVGNAVSNTTLISFGPNLTSPWGTVTDITIWTALTSGICLAQGTSATPVSYAIGDTATVAIGAFTVTLV